MSKSESFQIPEPPITRFIFADTRLVWLWLVIRIYVGWVWLEAGWEKINSPAWVGPEAGKALTGFIMGALKKTAGEHPDVSAPYAAYLQSIVLPNVGIFSHVVAYGEVLVGIGLIFGLFTGIAAFFGALMNMNFLLAGAVSVNPILFVLELFLILAWRVAGFLGLDRFALPLLGAPWFPGKLFKKT